LESLAGALDAVGRNEEALAAWARSRDSFRTLSEAQPGDRQRRSEWAHGEMIYSMVLHKDHRSSEALEVIQRARSILGTSVRVDPATHDFAAELMELYEAEGVILHGAGRVDEAIASYKKARDIGEALFRANPENATTSHDRCRSPSRSGTRRS